MTSKNYDYDVIVIGAGPAGSCFSRIAAGAGLNVMVIDKRKEIGVPVRCGEALGLGEIIKQDLDIPKHCYSLVVDGAKIVGPNGKAIKWVAEDTRGYVLERKFFDKWLAELAVEKGATVKTYSRATEVLKDEKGKLCGVKVTHGGREPYDITAPLIVSAEGMESLMARAMGFKTVHALYDVDTCYEYEMKPYDHENLIELYFGNQIAPRGYVWIFPKADKKANVGIGIGANIANGEKRGGIKGADPKILLDEFIEKDKQLQNASSLLDFGGVISVGAPINEFVKDNAMVIGTAAKQVDPIHGGGIGMAMEAGVMAAKVAIDAHKKKDFSKNVLYPYEKEWRATTGVTAAHRLKLRKVLEKVSDDDFNHVFNSINEKDLPEIMNGKFAGPVAKILAGRPQLLAALSGLLS
ncbi:NAD(P)/FAD-dependent oxidoreductase [Candidatus Micrarchaeota archaeon]|nr:NAD(P)/FAD-dependent oxidoreductase [Candidatus Micrarchaeota archaeon]